MAKRGWLVVVLALLLMPALSTIAPSTAGGTLAAQGVDQETETLFLEAIDLYKRGRDAEALEKVKQVLATDPSNEAAFLLREKVHFSLWVDLMTKSGEHRAVINEFLRLAAVGERDKRKDPDAVAKLLEELRTGDYAARRAAILKIAREHGDLAVPAIVQALAETSNDDYRNDLLQLLRQLGPEATLPLVQCLKSPDLALKTPVIIALGLIRDERAAAALKATVESGTEEALITAAKRALNSLSLPESLVGLSAKELYVDMAAKYYRRSPAVMKEFSATRVIWHWAGDKLASYDVPIYLYHLYIAEEACYDALAVDPDCKPPQVWLARVHLAQKQELQAAAARGSDEARELAEKMAKAEFLAASAGVDNLEEAVRVSIQDQDLATAEAGIFTLGELLTGPTFQGGVLTEALTAKHKLIRYAAAIVVGNLAPAASFSNSGAVTAELSRCVAESTLRTILVIDDDMETRNQLLAELREFGYFAAGAPNGAMGVLLAKRPPTPDLVILKTTLGESETSIATQGVLSEIKGDVRTKDTPVIGLAPEARADADADLFGDKLAGMIKIPLVKDAYAGLVKDSFGERGEDQAKALHYAELAAKALAKLAMADKLDPRRALGDLIGALGDKPDNVKLPAIAALGGIGDASALPALKDTFTSDLQSPAVRAAAAIAIGQICRNTGGVDLDVFQALLQGLGSSDMAVAKGAAHGLGIAPLSAAQRTEVVVQHRITLGNLFPGAGE
ncbi:MAG: HEAT repeat domain-containing protein [Planctomycetes bacterium]|nr:HEAT repeat domain-containing protein [Planctomycetota bacterium]